MPTDKLNSQILNAAGQRGERGYAVKKISTVLLAMIICAGLLAGCKPADDKAATDRQVHQAVTVAGEQTGQFPVTFTNFDEKGARVDITFTKAPDRVISLTQITTELMLDLELEDKLIGVANFDSPVLPRHAARLAKIPVLAAQYPSKEQLIAQNPELLVSWRMPFLTEDALGSAKDWRDRGIQVYLLRLAQNLEGVNTLETYYKEIEDFGKMFAIRDRAGAYIAKQQNRIAAIQSRLGGVDRKVRVMMLIVLDGEKFGVWGQDHFVADMISKAGGETLVAKSSPINQEVIVEQNPDILICAAYAIKGMNHETVLTRLQENKALQNVAAVKNNRILVVDFADINTGGVRVVDTIETFAKAFYPELLQ